MRSGLRKGLVIALCTALGAAGLLALPPVQVRLARAFLGGTEVELAYLWVGPRGLSLEGLRFKASGVTVDIATAELDVAFWSSLLGLRLELQDAALRGVDVRLDRQLQVARDVEAEPPAFSGFESIARIPTWLALRELAADGNVTLRTARGDIEAAGPWQLTMSGIVPDATAAAQFAGTLDARRAGETLAASRIEATATARIAADSRVLDMALDAQILPVDDSRRGVRAAAALAFDDAGEHYTLTIDGIAAGRLVDVAATFARDGNVSGTWQVNVTPSVIAAFARGRSVADLSGTSSGRFAFERANRRLAIDATARGEAGGWEAFDPRLAALDTLNLDLDVHAAVEPEAVDASTVLLAVSSAARGQLLRVALLQPLRFERGSWLVDPETRGEPALRIEANALPLQWLNRFSPAANLEGGEVSGAIDFVRDEDRVTRVVVTEPLRATAVQLRPILGIPIAELDVVVVPHVTLANGALEAEIDEFTMTAATGFRLELAGGATTSRTSWPVVEFEGTVAAHVPMLQRIAPLVDRVHGTTRMSFDFSSMMLTVAAAAVGASSNDGRQLLAADLSGQEPLRIRAPNFAADWDSFNPQTLTIELDGMPIDWLSPYIPELSFRGGEASGQLTLVGGGGRGVHLTAGEPITIADILPSFRGREARQTVTASVRPRLSLTNAASSFVLEDVRLETPSGDLLTGEIDVEAPAGSGPIAISIAFDGNFRTWAQRFSTGFSRLRFRERAELEPELRRFKVYELALDVVNPDGMKFLEVETLQPFFLVAEPFSVAVDGGAADILRVAVTPLELAQVVPRIIGFDLEGVLPQGEFFGRADPEGRLVLAADEPLVFRDVTVRWGEATLLDRVTMGVQYEVAYSGLGVEARSVDLTATATDGRVLVHATSEAVAPLTNARLLERAHVAIEANMAPLSVQPIFADLRPFTAGTLAASVDFANGSEATVALRLGIEGASAEGGALPELDARFDAAGVLGEHVRFTLPVRIESGEQGASSLRLEGTARREAGGLRTFEAALTGERLAIGDLDRLSAAFEPPVPEAADSAPAQRSGLAPLSDETRSAIAKLRAEVDSVPAWTDRLRGTATIDVGAVAYPSLTIEGLKGRLEVAPARAALRGLEARLFDARLKADAVVGFATASQTPYTLDFAATVDDFDLGRLLRAAAPDVTPVIEGTFDLATSLKGTGRNPLDLALSSLGEIRLEGRNGVFRGLAAQQGTGSTAARVSGILTFSKELRAVGRILDRIGELRFEDAELVLARTTADRLEVGNLVVRGPELRLTARGSLERTGPRQPVVLSPLALSAQFAARGDVGILFDGMELLTQETDVAGYRSLTRPVSIGGSLAEPDMSGFWEVLEQGAENAGGSFGVAMRALDRRLQSAAAAE